MVPAAACTQLHPGNECTLDLIQRSDRGWQIAGVVEEGALKVE